MYRRSQFSDKDLEVFNAIVVTYEETNKPVGPRKLGMSLGWPKESASSRVADNLNRLVALGWLTKFKGKYTPVIEREQGGGLNV